MRICFIALGEFAHVDAYLDFFAKRGHELFFVALAPGPARNVPTYNVGFNGQISKLLSKWAYLPSMLRARKIVRKLKPDLVHAHYATSAGLAAWIVDCHPWIVTAHGTDVTLGVKSRIWRKLLQAIFQEADCVNAVSDELRLLILGLGTPPEKIKTFTLGIDTCHFKFSERSFPRPAGLLRLVSTRRLEPVYDHATIVRSLAILRRRGLRFELTLIGDGILRKQLEALAAQLGVEENITFVGAVPNARLPAFLEGHEIYLSASTRDGTSLCLLEAMASGLFPVVSDIKANTEWIKHGHNGLLHKVSDPQSLADCLISLLGDDAPGRRAAILHNREIVVRRGDRTANMLRLEEIYSKLAQTGRTGGPTEIRHASLCRAGSSSRMK